MGINWGAVSGLLTSVAPMVATLATGPVGSIIRAVSSAVVIVENFVSTRKGAGKKQRAIDLVGSLLVVAEDAAGKYLVSHEKVRDAVGAVIDAEVALRNAYAALAAVTDDVQATQAA